MAALIQASKMVADERDAMGQFCSRCGAGRGPEDGSSAAPRTPGVEAGVVRIAEDSHARGEMVDVSVADCLRALAPGQALRVRVDAPCELLFAPDGEHLVIAGAGDLVNVQQEARVRFRSDEVLGDEDGPRVAPEELARADERGLEGASAAVTAEDAATEGALQALTRAKLTRAPDGPTRRRLSSMFELQGEARV